MLSPAHLAYAGGNRLDEGGDEIDVILIAAYNVCTHVLKALSLGQKSRRHRAACYLYPLAAAATTPSRTVENAGTAINEAELERDMKLMGKNTI